MHQRDTATTVHLSLDSEADRQQLGALLTAAAPGSAVTVTIAGAAPASAGRTRSFQAAMREVEATCYDAP